MIPCGTFRDLFELHRDGALAGAEAVGVRDHLRDCADCRGFETDAAALLAPLAGFPTGPYLPPLSPLPPWIGGAGGLALLLGAFLAAGVGTWTATRERGPDVEFAGGTRTVTGPAGRESRPLPAGPTTVRAGNVAEGVPVVGRVVGPDGAGVEGARFEFAGLAARTDAAGLFTLEGVPPGLARPARVAAPGAPSFEVLLPPIPAGTATVLAPIEAGPPAAVRVRVVDEAARPVAGARVEAFRTVESLLPEEFPTFRAAPEVGGLPAFAATSAADGTAAFAALPGGRWSFRARADGRSPSRVEDRRVGAAATVELLLEKGNALDGEVRDAASGGAIPGAAIAWIRAADARYFGDLRFTRFGTADERGAFAFADLPAEPVFVAARRPGAASFGGTTALPGGRVARVTLSLPDEGTLTGWVVEQGSGRPVAGAVLSVQNSTGVASSGSVTNEFHAITGEDGGFLLERIFIADAATLVRHLRSRGNLGSAETLVGFAPRSRQPLAEPCASVRLVLPPAGTVEGRVLDGSGRPVPGAVVRAFAPRWAPSGTLANPSPAGIALADAEGRYRLVGVPEGPIALHVETGAGSEPRPEVQRRAEAAFEGRPSAARLALCTAGTTVVSDLAAPPPGPPDAGVRVARIAGTILDEGGRPVPGARLTWCEGTDVDLRILELMPRFAWVKFGWPVPVTESGEFEREVVLASGPPTDADGRRSLLLAASAPGHATTRVLARVGPGVDAAPTRILLRRGAAVRGRVVTADGAPVAAVPVEASAEPSTPSLPQTLTASDGTFTLEGLAATPRHLLVGWWHEPLRMAAAPLDSGEALIRLHPARDLAVRVLAPGGGPLSEFAVTWTPAEPGGITLLAWTGEDGVARFLGVPDLPCRVVAAMARPGSHREGRFLPASAGVRPGEENPVTVTLAPALCVSGAVEGPGGLPLAGAAVEASFEGPVKGRPCFVRTSTRDDGSFDLRGLPGGAHRVTARWRGLEGQVEAEAGTTGLRLRAEGPAGATSRGVEIRGRVLDAGRRPVAGADLSLRATGARGVACAMLRTDAEGRFSLPAARGAAYTLVARFPSGEAVHLDGLVADGAAPEILPGGAPGRLHGRVLKNDGTPAAAVRVVATLRDAAGATVPDLSLETLLRSDALGPGATLLRWTVTAADGSFDLGSPPGAWSVSAGGPPVAREDGDPSPLEILLGE